MPFVAPNVGAVTQLGIDSANPVGKAYEFIDFDIQAHQEYIYPGGVRGILDHQGETRTTGIVRVGGTMKLKPTNAFLSAIGLQWALGGTPTGTGTLTYPEANTLFGAYITADRVATVDTYGLCWVDALTLTSEEGRELETDWDILAQTETIGAAGSFPAGLVPPYAPPFVHSSSGNSFTLNAVVRQVKRISIRLSNNLLRDRFFASTTLATSAKTDRVWDVTVSVPFTSDNTDLYNLPPTTVATGIFAWSDGTKTLTFTAGQMQLNGPPTKRINGKTDELMMDIPLQAMAHSTTPAMSVTM